MSIKSKRILAAGLICLAVAAMLVLYLVLSRQEDGVAVVSVTANEFSLENRKKEVLNFSYGEITGDMEAEQYGEFSEGVPAAFEMDNSGEFLFTTAEPRVRVAIEAENWSQAFDGSGVSRARFVGNEGMSLEGEGISGTVSINYPAGEILTPFRLSVYSESGLSVNTTDTGLEVHGVSGLIPLRASYNPALNKDIQFTYVELGSFSGSISIDLSELESEGHLIVTAEDGSQETVDIL